MLHCISGEVEETQICANFKNKNQVSITYDVQKNGCAIYVTS